MERAAMSEDAMKLNRRTFPQRTASFTALSAASFVLPAAHTDETKASDDPMRVPGILPRPTENALRLRNTPG